MLSSPAPYALVLAVALGMSATLTGCDSSRSSDATTAPVDGTEAVSFPPDGETESHGGTFETTDGEVTQTEGDAGSDGGTSPAGLDRMKIPAVAGLPEPRTMDEVADAVIQHMAKEHPHMDVSSVEVIGSNTNEYSEESGSAVSDFWCSYLLKSDSDETVGVEVVCSKYMKPCVTELDLIRATDGYVYDVIDNAYLLAEEVKARSTRNEPYDPFSTNPDGSLRQRTVVDVEDSKGNVRHINFTDDLG